MGVRDKEEIEKRFGPLWSGVDTITVGDRIFTLDELKRAFDLWASDIVGIDLHVLPDELYAFRFYDGDDRRIVVFVFDKGLEITGEYRAHIAEWLGNEYYASGIKAYVPDEMILMLRHKLKGQGENPPG